MTLNEILKKLQDDIDKCKDTKVFVNKKGIKCTVRKVPKWWFKKDDNQ